MSTTGRSDTDLIDLADAYALDAVSAAERRAIERRRARADDLTAAEFDYTVAALHDTLAELSAVDICPAPAELEANLLAALDRAVRAAGRPRRLRDGLRGGLLAAAAVVLLGLLGIGYLVTANNRGEPRPGEVTAVVIAAAPDVIPHTVTVSGGGALRVQTSASLSAASIAFAGVSAPPPGRSYQVWLVPLGGTPRSIGVLRTVPDRPLVTTFEPVDTLAITLEPADGSPQPTTTPVSSLNLG